MLFKNNGIFRYFLGFNLERRKQIIILQYLHTFFNELIISDEGS